MFRLLASRILFWLPVLLMLTISAYADVPKVISYQGRLTDNLGNPVPDGEYQLTFQIVEHDPLPMGESPLWSSGAQTVTVTDGLFIYYLGSNVPLPAEIFNDDGLDSYFLRINVGGSPTFMSGIEMVTAPFSVRSIYSDTAAYALAGPGGGANGWIDDGSVVRLETYSDFVGIGTNSPNAPLVVGKDLGSYLGQYIVSGSYYLDDVCGFKMGFNADNHATIRWDGDGAPLALYTREQGTDYYNTLALRSGNVGIGVTNPTEPLVVGSNLGTYSGNRIVVGDQAPANYTGLVMGEDADNRAFLTWSIDGNYFDIGIEDEGTQWSQMIKLQDGEVKVGTGSGDASVQLPNGAISSSEILNETGVARYNAYLNGLEIIRNEWTTLSQKNCNFPSSGYALVLVTCEVETHFPRIHLDFGVTHNGGAAPNHYSRFLFFDDALQDNCETFNMHELFNVSAGSNSFDFVGYNYGGTLSQAALAYNTSMTILFIPSSYAAKDRSVATGIFDETAQPVFHAAESGTGMTSDFAESSPTVDQSNVMVSPKVNSHTNAPADGMSSGVSQADQISALRAEFEAKLRALEEEIAELKQNQ